MCSFWYLFWLQRYYFLLKVPTYKDYLFSFAVYSFGCEVIYSSPTGKVMWGHFSLSFNPTKKGILPLFNSLKGLTINRRYANFIPRP